MSFFKGKTTKLEIKLRDVIINYCISNSNISSKEDGRLTIIENECRREFIKRTTLGVTGS